MGPLHARQDRRAFVAGLARYLTLGALATLSGILYSRNRSASPNACINLEICSGCSAFRGCRLPPALLTRNASEEDSHAR
jgi:hypothetical protein